MKNTITSKAKTAWKLTLHWKYSPSLSCVHEKPISFPKAVWWRQVVTGICGKNSLGESNFGSTLERVGN